MLFCGLGSIGQRHLRNLRTLMGDSVEVLAYRSKGHSPVLNPDLTVSAGADLETTYGVRSFDDLNQALVQRPDAVFVTGPNSTHLPVAMAAARAGCHLFIEKPVSHSTEGLDELIDLVERNGLVALVAFQFRFHPGLLLLKDLIESGKLGRIVAAHVVNGEYLPGWHPYEDYRETHPARREMGGGCLNIQTHELDYALWLFGMPKRLFAVGGHLSRLEVDVDDSVSVLLECGWEGRPLPVHVHLDYVQRPPQRTCEVIGDGGKARYDYYANHVEFSDTATNTVESKTFDGFDRNQMFVDELNHFLACMRGEAKPVVGLRDGVQSVRVSLAAHESLRTGRSMEMSHV
ncbi:MAG: Gfo/Idh/MocA family protein [Pyrinomonadaceae bacterium]